MKKRGEPEKIVQEIRGDKSVNETKPQSILHIQNQERTTVERNWENDGNIKGENDGNINGENISTRKGDTENVQEAASGLSGGENNDLEIEKDPVESLAAELDPVESLVDPVESLAAEFDPVESLAAELDQKLDGSLEKRQQSSSGQKTTLWMGELDIWMDEYFLREKWREMTGQSVSVKLIRDKYTGLSAGYAFINFTNHATPAKCLQTLNGTLIPGTQSKLKLNWATGGISGVFSGAPSFGPEFSVFVGDLSPEVTDEMLLTLFQLHYPSVRSAKVVLDMTKGISKGYGFVRFADELEQRRALEEMTGQICGSKAIRVSIATPKNRLTMATHPIPNMPIEYPVTYDPHNTTVFVGGLSPRVNEEELKSHFLPFGEISYVKIPPHMGCGFVAFAYRQSAEMAIQQMPGYNIGGSPIRVSWGNSHPMYYQPYPRQYIPMPYNTMLPHMPYYIPQMQQMPIEVAGHVPGENAPGGDAFEQGTYEDDSVDNTELDVEDSGMTVVKPNPISPVIAQEKK